MPLLTPFFHPDSVSVSALFLLFTYHLNPTLVLESSLTLFSFCDGSPPTGLPPHFCRPSLARLSLAHPHYSSALKRAQVFLATRVCPKQHSMNPSPIPHSLLLTSNLCKCSQKLCLPAPQLCIGEDNGKPLQYSCLENPMDGGAWWAAVYGVSQRLDTTEAT